MLPSALTFLKYRLPSGPSAGVSASLTAIDPEVTSKAAFVPGSPSWVRSQLPITFVVMIWRRPQAVAKANDFAFTVKGSGQLVTFSAPATRYRVVSGDASTT